MALVFNKTYTQSKALRERMDNKVLESLAQNV